MWSHDGGVVGGANNWEERVCLQNCGRAQPNTTALVSSMNVIEQDAVKGCRTRFHWLVVIKADGDHNLDHANDNGMHVCMRMCWVA